MKLKKSTSVASDEGKDEAKDLDEPCRARRSFDMTGGKGGFKPMQVSEPTQLHNVPEVEVDNTLLEHNISPETQGLNDSQSGDLSVRVGRKVRKNNVVMYHGHENQLNNGVDNELSQLARQDAVIVDILNNNDSEQLLKKD